MRNVVTAHQVESSYACLRALASLALMTCGGVAMFAVVVILKPVAEEFGVTRSMASIPFGVTMLGFGLGGILMGRWADRSGVMRPATFGSVVLALGFVLAGNAQNLWQLCLLQGVMIGLLGHAAVFTPLVADITHWFDRRRGMAVAVVISGNYLAGAVWPPIIQHFIDEVGWRQTYMGIGVFCFCSMLPLTLALRPKPPEAVPGAQAFGGDPRRDLGLRPARLQSALCLAGVGCCVAMAMPQVHIVALVGDLGHAAQRGAEMLAIMFGCGVVSRLISGWISDRIGGLETLILGSVLQALALALFLPAHSLWALYVVAALFGLGQGGIVPSYAVIVQRYFPIGEVGRRLGTVMFATMAGMALGGWLAGALHDLAGDYSLALIGAIAFNLLNLGVVAWLLARARRGPVGGAEAPARALPGRVLTRK